MKRNLIVASVVFAAGLLVTAFVTLSLLMSLIRKPELLSTDLIAGAVGKSLAALEKSGSLRQLNPGRTIPGPKKTLTATVIGKAIQKGLPVIGLAAFSDETVRYEPVFSQRAEKNDGADLVKEPQADITAPVNRKSSIQEDLVYELLSLQGNRATEEEKRDIAIRILELQHPDGGWSYQQGISSDPCATGQALYALQESGILHSEAPDSQKALAFLLRSQQANGGWMIAANDNEEQEAVKTIEEETTNWASLALLGALPDRTGR